MKTKTENTNAEFTETDMINFAMFRSGFLPRDLFEYIGTHPNDIEKSIFDYWIKNYKNGDQIKNRSDV